MLRDPRFWDSERNIPLMSLNKDFCNEENLDTIFAEVSELAKAFTKPLQIEPILWPGNLEPSRIIEKDVERTFTASCFRSRMNKLLMLLESRFKDYHQGLSFLVSFLMLFEEDDVIVSIVERLNQDEEFIPGYWKHEAVAFATDAYVLDHLLLRHNPRVCNHLRGNTILPATYPQKWFVALCVHILPFDALCSFLKQFFARGIYFLFQFGLAFFDILGPSILASTCPVHIFAYLRLDSSIVPIDDSIPAKIVHRAQQITLDEIKSFDDLQTLRKKMYDEHLGTKYESLSQPKSSNATDQFDDSSEEDGEYELGSECQICENMVPDYWCCQCDKFVCGMCADTEAGNHKKDAHKLISASSAPCLSKTPSHAAPQMNNSTPSPTEHLATELQHLKV